jgi:hypothetical protein
MRLQFSVRAGAANITVVTNATVAATAHDSMDFRGTSDIVILGAAISTHKA